MDNVNARIVSMIEVTYNTGDGTEKNPSREVVEYHLTDGTLIARNDPFQALSIDSTSSSVSSDSM